MMVSKIGYIYFVNDSVNFCTSMNHRNSFANVALDNFKPTIL